MSTAGERVSWLERRRQSLGASDAPVIAGLSRYKSRYALWLEKTGEAMQDDGPSEEAWWGLELENVIKHRLSTHHEVETVAQQVTMSHEDHPWLTCTIDGVDENGEIWEDELGSFKANLFDNCSSKDKYLAIRVKRRSGT